LTELIVGANTRERDVQVFVGLVFHVKCISGANISVCQLCHVKFILGANMFRVIIHSIGHCKLCCCVVICSGDCVTRINYRCQCEMFSYL